MQQMTSIHWESWLTDKAVPNLLIQGYLNPTNPGFLVNPTRPNHVWGLDWELKEKGLNPVHQERQQNWERELSNGLQNWTSASSTNLSSGKSSIKHKLLSLGACRGPSKLHFRTEALQLFLRLEIIQNCAYIFWDKLTQASVWWFSWKMGENVVTDLFVRGTWVYVCMWLAKQRMDIKTVKWKPGMVFLRFLSFFPFPHLKANFLDIVCLANVNVAKEFFSCYASKCLVRFKYFVWDWKKCTLLITNGFIFL